MTRGGGSRNRRRRGMTLPELLAAGLLFATLSAPLMIASVETLRESARVQAEMSLQWDLDQALGRLARVIREATVVQQAEAAALEISRPTGVRHRWFVQGQELREQLGVGEPFVLARNVTALRFSYFAASGGQILSTSNLERIGAVRVDLTLSRAGFTRSGSVLVELRNRS